MKIIEVKNLSFSYNQRSILENISFSIEEGDYIALAGPNGAGKTTLIRILLELEKASSGEISYNNFNLKKETGYLPQNSSSISFFPAKVEEIISLGLLPLKNFPKRINYRDREKIEEILNILDILSLKNKMISELSGGQTQKVLLGRALVSNPKLLILDEPGTGLDTKSRDSFFKLLEKINKEIGTSIIIITHDFSEIGKYAKKLLFIDKRMLFFGAFSDFCESKEMEKHFGPFSQHIICHQH